MESNKPSATGKWIPSGSIAIPDLKEVWCSYGGGHTFMSRGRVRAGVKRCCDDPAHQAEQREYWRQKAKKRMRKGQRKKRRNRARRMES